MRRTEILEGVRMMHDAVSRDVFGRCERRELSKLEAAELLGMSERQFRRWCRRLEAEGEAGLRDRRIRLPPYPQAQPPPKRSSNVLPKPDNLTCYYSHVVALKVMLERAAAVARGWAAAARPRPGV